MTSYAQTSEEEEVPLDRSHWGYFNQSVNHAGGGPHIHKPLSRHGRTALSLAATCLRKKSDVAVFSKVPCHGLRSLLINLQEIFLNTKLSFLFPFVVAAFVLNFLNFNQGWIFAASLVGLVPLAERLRFLTEQLALCTSPTIRALLNATCGNLTELIISMLALQKGEIDEVKWLLLGSVLSSLLLVLGTSLLAGGINNLRRPQLYDKKQSDIGIGLLFVVGFCHLLILVYGYAYTSTLMSFFPSNKLEMSRAWSIFMLVAYGMHHFSQLKTNSQLFNLEEVHDLEDDGDDAVDDGEPVLTWWIAMGWLIVITVLVAVLSEFIVNTMQEASQHWGISVSFTSIVLLPIVGNAAKHVGAVMFAIKRKLVPASVLVAWLMCADMDLDFKLMETGILLMTILVTASVLQDGTSN